MKNLTEKQNAKIAEDLINVLKSWELEGNKISSSDMFYYCPWYTGENKELYKKAA